MAPVSPQEESLQEKTNNTPTKDKNSYQELLSNAIGDFGRWQVYLIFAHFTPKILMAWSMIIISFGGGKTDWWRETSTNTTCKCFDFKRFLIQKTDG